MRYEAPALTVVGTLAELTLLIPKNTVNTPDGYSYHHVPLTT
jgi:hypothetical protein